MACITEKQDAIRCTNYIEYAKHTYKIIGIISCTQYAKEVLRLSIKIPYLARVGTNEVKAYDLWIPLLHLY